MIAGNSPRVIAAGAIGNVLEWYDFAVYGYFATAIGRAFFPREDPVAQVLSAFGIFAVGFLMRPVGGALVGHIGDKYGRRVALTFSVAAMAIPTFLVGVLPGYEVLGMLAPIALTFLRMVLDPSRSATTAHGCEFGGELRELGHGHNYRCRPAHFNRVHTSHDAPSWIAPVSLTSADNSPTRSEPQSALSTVPAGPAVSE